MSPSIAATPPQAPAMLDQQPCPACKKLNAVPYLFCAHCGAPRLHIGRWRISINVFLALAAMLGNYYFTADIGWDWPLYVLYMLLLLQFMLAMTVGRPGATLRVVGWFSLFMAGSLALCTMYHMENLDLLVHALATAPAAASDAALNYPLVFYPCLLIVLVIIFLPAYLRWGRLYGWVNAYRVVILTWLAIMLAVVLAFRAGEFAHDRGYLSDLEPFLGNFVAQNSAVAHVATFCAVSLLRLFLIEVCTFAALQGYSRVRQAQVPTPHAAGESVFVRSALALLGVARQAGQTIELMARYLIDTLRKLVIDLFEVIVAFFRELFIPALAMAGTGYLLYSLALATRAYIDTDQFLPFLRALASAFGVLFCALVFLACKSRTSAVRLAGFYVQLVGWLLPNLMLFFLLLLSLSLYATGRVLNSKTEEPILPFRLGWLTRVDAIILGVLLIVVFARKRTLLTPQPAAASAPATQTPHEDEPPEVPLTPDGGGPEPPAEPEKKKGWLRTRAGALTDRPEVRGGVAQVKSAMQGLKDMAAGKPAVIGQLAKVREALEAKEIELSTLEAMRGTLSPETFETLRYTALGEVNALRAERDTIQLTINQRYMNEKQQQEKLRQRTAALRVKYEEFKRLESAGIGGKTAKDQAAKIKNDLEAAESKLELNQRNLVWYLEESTLPTPEA